MQPTFLPWAGYFGLIFSVDMFVFLDTVQFNRDSWQVYNKFLLKGDPCKVQVPVVKAHLRESIDNIFIDSADNWINEYVKFFDKAYRCCPWGVGAVELISKILYKKHNKLVDLNVDLITQLTSYIGIATSFVRSSELKSTGTRSEYLKAICKELNCKDYLSTIGAREYLAKDDFENQSDINLRFYEFHPIPYPQLHTLEFKSHLSILDVLANCGPEATKDYISEKKTKFLRD